MSLAADRSCALLSSGLEGHSLALDLHLIAAIGSKHVSHEWTEAVMTAREPDRSALPSHLSGRLVTWVEQVDRARWERLGGRQLRRSALPLVAGREPCYYRRVRPPGERGARSDARVRLLQRLERRRHLARPLRADMSPSAGTT